MINVRGTLRGEESRVDINMGPLIDMVFLLLIFFVVTTSFVKETGIDVQRSTAATAETTEHGNILLGVSADGGIYFEGKRIDVRSVRAHIERAPGRGPRERRGGGRGPGQPDRRRGQGHGPVPTGRRPQREPGGQERGGRMMRRSVRS